MGFFNWFFDSPQTPEEPEVWVGTIKGIINWSDTKTTSVFYYQLYEKGNKRYYRLTGDNVYDKEQILDWYSTRILPWIKTGDKRFISKILCAWNSEWWNDTKNILPYAITPDEQEEYKQKQKQKKKPEFKVLEFPKKEETTDES